MKFAFPRISAHFRALVVSIIAASLFLASCRNEDQVAPDVQEQISPDQEFEAYYKVISFIEKREGSSKSITTRSSTTYDTTEMKFYLEGTMNLMYTDNSVYYTSVEIDSFEFTVAHSGLEVDESDLLDLFDEVVDSASTHFYSLPGSDKVPILYDARILSVSGFTINVEVHSMVGLGFSNPTPFGSTDYWHVAGGKCGPYSGGTDEAGDLIEGALNQYYTSPVCVFYTQVTNDHSGNISSWENTNPTDPNPGDFILDYRTYRYRCEWYEDATDCSEELVLCNSLDEDDIRCLAPNELNYYYSSILSLYNNYVENDIGYPFEMIMTDIYRQVLFQTRVLTAMIIQPYFLQINSNNEKK